MLSLLDCSFNPAGDMGTSNADIEYMLSSINVKKQLENYRSSQSGVYTAVSVSAGAEAALRHVGRTLVGATVAIDSGGYKVALHRTCRDSCIRRL